MPLSGQHNVSFFIFYFMGNFVPVMLQRSQTPPAVIPKDVITLEEVLQEMERTDRHGNPIPFSIVWLSYNEQKNTGGEYLSFDSAIYPKVKGIRAVKAKPGRHAQPGRIINQFKNAIRNIQEYGTEQLYAAHIWSIAIFNQRRVVWYIHG